MKYQVEQKEGHWFNVRVSEEIPHSARLRKEVGKVSGVESVTIWGRYLLQVNYCPYFDPAVVGRNIAIIIEGYINESK